MMLILYPFLKNEIFYDTRAERYLELKDNPGFKSWYHAKHRVKRSDWGSLLDFFLGKFGKLEINFYQTVEEFYKKKHVIVVSGWLHYYVFYVVNSDNDLFDAINKSLSKCDDFYKSTDEKILSTRYEEIKLWASSI